MKSLVIHPPLLNSANPWCSTLEQLEELYASPHTGAVTTRTSLLEGFPNDESIHQFAFYNPSTHEAATPNKDRTDQTGETGSLNTLGYSPTPLRTYLEFIKTISDRLNDEKHYKPFIVSVTGSVEDVVECYQLISAHQRNVRMVLAMEVNLSCPNIPDKPPPAYDSASLLSYLSALKIEVGKQLGSTAQSEHHKIHVPIGIKTPPYTYHDQFKNMIEALRSSAKLEPQNLPCPISFITATNTLGSSLLLTPTIESAQSPGGSKEREVFHHTLNSATGTGIGGLAGAPLHPLALGNVYTIKGLLFQYSELEHIQIIGIGGVEDVNGYQRMRAVGAAAVGVGTALGRKGVRVFEEIGEALQKGGH
ncbi:FMN-linked oxidoreductase [Aaosphaeria arxii CBS 175.79]|uniref:Dihydroorotate dehydrogenase (fumarate) n=1 Tax=Aaosphaeria arxii CBS 175.79 TaxID=1450172 RepID=A0A6A5Y1J5_9PLEO|nr:FMN-linked oxidoreductase [Aaosphaeria arxii CBS 175.79]KAF2019116.1 FMN-linked oxidoreductase [Aaosphaeria arxii CBS 175.79]